MKPPRPLNDDYHIRVVFLPRRLFRQWRASVTGQGAGKYSSFPTFYASDERAAVAKAEQWCARDADRQGHGPKTVKFNPRGQADG